MRSSFTKFSSTLLVVVLSTGILAVPALASDRESPRRDRDRDNPVVRVVKLLKHFFATILDEEQVGVPKP